MTENNLILLPGLLCDAALWQHQTTALSAHLTCHVPDMTGHDSVHSLAASILATAPPQFGLAGLSMGGYVAMEIMRLAPHRVSRLVLSDTVAHPDSDSRKQARQALIKLAGTGKFKGVTPRLLPQLLHPDNLENTAITGVIFEMAARIGQHGFVQQQHLIMSRPDSRPDLPHYTVPTLVMVGEQDSLSTPVVMTDMAALIPGARFEIIPHAGHLPPLEQPDLVTRLLVEFLT